MVATPTTTASPGFTLAIGGRRWWNGLTAEATLTNTSGKDLSDWSVTFTSAHRPSGTPWGCSLSTVELGGGLVQITLRGTGWPRAAPWQLCALSLCMPGGTAGYTAIVRLWMPRTACRFRR